MSVRSTTYAGKFQKTSSSKQGTLSKSEALEVFPPEIVFKDIEPDQTYEVTVSVRNLCQRVRRIRFVPPKTSKFLAEYNNLGAIAGGIQTNIIISFETDHLGNFHDEMIIISEDFSYTLLMHAYQPSPDIQFDPFVNMGLTSIGKVKTSLVTFKNEGSRKGSVNLNFDKSISPELNIEPDMFSLAANERMTVKMVYNPREVGIFRCPVEVIVDGQEKVRHIDVNGTCVEHQMSVVAPNLEKIMPTVSDPDNTGAHLSVINSLNFGNMYHGEVKEMVAYLVNNGPVPVSFSLQFILGSEEEVENEQHLTHTPQELAKQEIKRVMRSEPEIGIVEAYSQVLIKFFCHSKVPDRVKGWAHNVMEEGNPEKNFSHPVESMIDYFYTAVFKFREIDQKLLLQLQARAVFPNIKISSNAIFFPPCSIGDRRDVPVKIENLNDALEISYNFSKIAQFTVDPDQGKLLPKQSKTLNFAFTPKNYGIFHSSIFLQFVSGAYKFPIHFYAKCEGMTEKKTLPVRGTESLPKDFEPERKYVSDLQIYNALNEKEGKWKSETKVETLKTDYSLQVDQAILQDYVKKQYVDFLRASRRERLEKSKKTEGDMKFEDIAKQPDLGMSENLISGPVLRLPRPDEQLFVNKSIGLYETAKGMSYNHDPDRPIRNARKKAIDRKKYKEVAFSQVPRKQVEIRECSKVLTAQELQFISAGPRVMDFGKVVVCSSSCKYFSVVNALKQNVLVELETNMAEIHKIEPNSLVIPAGMTGGFQINLLSARNQVLDGVVTYKINKEHAFHFKVSAKMEQAELRLSKDVLKFTFDDENMEESLTEKVLIENVCTADTKFTWIIPSGSNFEVEPREEVIEAKKSKTVNVKFTPAIGGVKAEAEILQMRVQNGPTLEVKCKGEFNEAKCVFTQKQVDFEVVSIGIPHEKPVVIKNLLRTTAVFHVKNCPNELSVSPMKGKIPGDGRLSLKIEFCAMEEKEIHCDLEVVIRGGKPLNLTVVGKAIIPTVYIVEPDIDFGGVTYKCSATRQFSVVNDSPIACSLYINLAEHEEFEISLPPDKVIEGVYESNILVPATGDKKNPFATHDENDELEQIKQEAGMQEEESDDEPEEVARTFRLNLGPNTTVTLQLKFTPNDTETYLFDLPVLMAGVSEQIKSLVRRVTGEGLQPRFLIDPSVVDFKKKYITGIEKTFPEYKDIVFSNPDIMPLRWRLEPLSSEASKVFTIKPTEGYLESSAPVTVRASFNPLQPVEYEEKIKLFLDNSTEAYLFLTLKGEGAVPRISFDRRYVILPVVPLGVTSKSVFRINNEGYQNVELKYRTPKDIAKIPISLNFPDGSSLGSTKQKITVEVLLNHDKPFSFTSQLEFYDSEGNRFFIPVAGTTDNSLLSIFSFIQRHSEDITYETDSNGATRVAYEENSDQDEYSGKWEGPKTSAASSAYSRSAKSIVGYQPIPQTLLDKGLEHLTRWMNHHILTNPISHFPEDFINQFGSPLFDLIHAVSGKTPAGMMKVVPNTSQKDLVKLLYKQYEDLLDYLKKFGALLNTVRPEFLMSQQEFSQYLKSTPNDLQLKPKQIQHRWPYMSMDSWTTLIFQIIKLYLLNRVTPKSFKTIPGIEGDATNIEPWMTSSNLYSVSESILLKWMTHHYSLMHPHTPKKISNFDLDIMDGTVFAAVIQSHAGSVKALTALKTNCTSEEQRMFNCEKIIAGLSEIGMTSYFTATDLARPSAREIVLFCLQLYQGLPHYIPKCKITFTCPLGEKIEKKLDLSNTSNKPINYWIRIEGSLDFSIDGAESLSIPPKQSVQFPVFFQSRVTTPVQRAKLSFTNRSNDGSAQAAALVFELVSDVKPPQTITQIDMETPLYKLLNKEVEVKNIYGQEAEFTISLVIQEEVKKPVAKKKGAPPETPGLTFPNPFFIKSEKVKVKKGSSSIIGIQFLPFEMRNYKADLILCDEKVGEVQYRINANVGNPEPIEIPPVLKVELGDSIQINVAVDPKNKPLEFAKSKCKERYQSSQKTKEREALNDILRKLQSDDTLYEVSLNSPYFTGPTQISLSDMKAKGKNLDNSEVSEVIKQEISLVTSKKPANRTSGSQTSAAEGSNKFLLNFAPKTPGDYPCQITVASSKKTDIRIYDVLVSVKPKRNVINLELVAFARSETKQDIPIINNSEKDWSVKVTLTQDTKDFSATKDFIVRKKSSGMCTVSFKPQWTCDVKGKLVLDVAATGEVYEFNLRGIGEEPRAEEHIILDCRVKETSTHLIPVVNNSEVPITYRVESDLINASGDPEITVPAKSRAKYELVIRPFQSGQYTGAITFYDPLNKFYWYTIEIRAAEPEPEDEKILMTQCRKPIELKITVFNPFAENTTFDVTIQGKGLTGDNLFFVAAKEQGVYELVFSPLIPGESEGAIFFMSEKTGEFWYKLKLNALPPEPIELPLFECELGRTESQTIVLENLTAEEAILDYNSSNPLNFELVPEKVAIPPYEVIEAVIKYCPSSLKHVENGVITLTSATLGNWEYKLRGKGVPPTKMEPLEVSATIGESSSVQVTFKNPFREVITVNLGLEGKEVFNILVKRNKFSIGPLGMLLIPVSFQPVSMEEALATLVVSITDDLAWRFPIRGITENSSQQRDFNYKTKCRNTIEQPLSIVLHDLEDLPEEENFTHEIRVPSKEFQRLVDNSFKIEPIKNIISSPDESLEFLVRFEPLRPFKTIVEFLIYKSSGGRWKYNIMLEALDPDVDDTIIIESQINKSHSVAFKLTNQLKAFAEFEAFFTPESNSCFSVMPTQGVLEPFGREGTQFVVTFSPNEYGAAKIGRLIIQTDDMRWIYTIKGVHPHYQPPEVQGGRLDNKPVKLPANNKKNFIRDNMKHISPKRSKMEGTYKSITSQKESQSKFE
jgi:hypothetical protein